MVISLRPDRLARYRDVARLLITYGHGDLVREAGLDRAFEGEPPPTGTGASREARDLAEDLEDLGPVYVKLGQLLSTRADVFPRPVLDALSRLQDRCESVPYEAIEETVEREIGARISKAFRAFDHEPVAAASLAQVHRAELRDGRPVAVKVQRPGIRDEIVDDLDALEEIAGSVLSRFEWGRRLEVEELVEQLRGSLIGELDFRREAGNLTRIGESLEEFDRILVPRPVEDYTTGRVLTMEFLEGRNVRELTPLRRIEIDGPALADTLFEAYLKQVLVDGHFHADPHPGNVFLTDDDRIALLDLGMTAHIGPDLQETLMKLLLAIAEGRGEDAADRAVEIGGVLPDVFDARAFRADVVDLVGRYAEATVEEMEMGRIVMEVSRIAGENGLRMAREMTMLGKTLLNLDEVGRALAPDFDPNAAIRRHAAALLERRMLDEVSPGNLVEGFLESVEFVKELPGRVNRIVQRLADNEFEVQVNAIDERTLVEGFQKIANRIASALLLAALIVGAALLMQIETESTIFGYPMVAMIGFLLAAGGGVWLLVSIATGSDSRPPGERP